MLLSLFILRILEYLVNNKQQQTILKSQIIFTIANETKFHSISLLTHKIEESCCAAIIHTKILAIMVLILYPL